MISAREGARVNFWDGESPICFTSELVYGNGAIYIALRLWTMFRYLIGSSSLMPFSTFLRHPFHLWSGIQPVICQGHRSVDSMT